MQHLSSEEGESWPTFEQRRARVHHLLSNHGAESNPWKAEGHLRKETLLTGGTRSSTDHLVGGGSVSACGGPAPPPIHQTLSNIMGPPSWETHIPDKIQLEEYPCPPYMKRAIIGRPEWLATLQLVSVRHPETYDLCLRLEDLEFMTLVPHREEILLQVVDRELEALGGPFQVQIFVTRPAFLRQRVGRRTRVRSGQATLITPGVTSEFFYTRVVEVTLEDLPVMVDKYVASRRTTPTLQAMALWRGDPPTHVPKAGRFQSILSHFSL